MVWPESATASRPPEPELVESYRRLADVFHEVLAEQSLDALLVRIADVLGDLIPHDTLTIYEADESQGVLFPVFARDQYEDEIMATRITFEEGITGWAARNREATLVNQAHLDPRVRFVPGTPIDPEALISIPLISRARIKGVLNIYRVGEEGLFTEHEFELAKRFADAAALALDNAQIRERLEHQAQTDSLTGLFNHRSFHERLLTALQDASRTHKPVAVLMLDIDDFKRVNDVYGHGVGDELLRTLADTLRSCVRPDDVVCRLGGEEFGVIMRACDGADAGRVAQRVVERLSNLDVRGVGALTGSIGLALGPEHAMNPRELTACAEAAMMTAKARGKNRVVLYDEASNERPDAPMHARDVRSIAHMKMLQSLSGKLNRLNDVREIGNEIAGELRSLIDYHNCRVFVVDGEELEPVAFRGEFVVETIALPLELLRIKIGQGITGRCAERAESLLIHDAANCEFGSRIPGTPAIEESLLAVPLQYGTRVVGVIVVSKLGLNQFDEDDVRLLEVLAGHAAVAVENASLYESARREADSATALLEVGRELATAANLDEIYGRIVRLTSDLIGSMHTSLWLADEEGSLSARKLHGVDEEAIPRILAMRFDVANLTRDFGSGTEPFILHARRLRAPRRRPARLRYVLRSCTARGRQARWLHCGVAARRRFRGARAAAARRPRASGSARDRKCVELRESRAQLRLDGRGARQRPRGERRIHVDTCALDHGSRAPRRQRARPRRPHAEASRARCAVARHRQDRHSERDPREARPAHRRRARDHGNASRARRTDHCSDRPPAGCPARSSGTAMSAGTAGAIRTA